MPSGALPLGFNRFTGWFFETPEYYIIFFIKNPLNWSIFLVKSAQKAAFFYFFYIFYHIFLFLSICSGKVASPIIFYHILIKKSIKSDKKRAFFNEKRAKMSDFLARSFKMGQNP